MTRLGPMLLCAAALSISTGATGGPAHRAHRARPSAAPRKTVAVLYFDNYTGKTDYDPLGKGIASMMTSDLSSVQEIQLVERDRIQDVVKESEMQQSKYFDSTTAVKMGHLVAAQYVVTGAVSALEPKIRIDTRVISVQTGEIVKTARVTGDKDKFFDLEDKLSHELIDGLAVALSPEEQQKLKAQQQANGITEMSTMLAFSQALDLSDRGDYVSAAEKLQPALRAAPGSVLLHMTYAHVKAKAAASAKASATDRVKRGLGGLLRKP